MILVLLDTKENRIGNILDFKDLKIDKEINKLDVLTLSLSKKNVNYDNVKEEMLIQTKDNIYVIKQVDISDPDYKTITSEIYVDSLKGTVIDNFSVLDGECNSTIDLALVGTGWAIGFSDANKKRNINKKQCTVYDVLQEIQNMYRCEMEFDALNKKINVYQSMGSDKGTYFMDTLNLKALNVQSNTNDYITQLIPLGANGITIESVNNNLKYVSNYQYTDKVLQGYWSDNRYTNAKDLMDDAVERLNELSKPHKSYSVDIINLANFNKDYKLLDYALGDSVTLLSKANNIKDNQRIKKLTIYPLEPEKNTAELSNILDNIENLITRFDNTSNAVDNITDASGSNIDGNSISVTDKDGNTNSLSSTLNSTNATIQNLTATKANVTELNAVTADIGNLKANKADVTDLNAVNASIEDLKTKKANIVDLQATNANIQNLEDAKANISDLQAANANIDTLKGKVGTFIDLDTDSLKSRIIDAQNIKTDTITAESGIIKSLDGGVLQEGIIHTELVDISGSDGMMHIHDNMLQIFQEGTDGKNFERIVLGDVNHNNTTYGLLVRDADGKSVLFDQDGITQVGFTNGYNHLNDNSLDPKKIDIEKTITRLNGANTKIDSSAILVGESTLSSKFEEVDKQVADIKIGGTNLLTGTKDWEGWNNSGNATIDNTMQYGLCIPTKVTTAWNYYYQIYDFKEIGKEYTLSGWVYTTGSNIDVGFYGWLGSGEGHQTIDPNKWVRWSYTFIVDGTTREAKPINIRLETGNATEKSPLWVCGLKLEEGNKATDWSLSPFDVQNQISNIQVGGTNLIVNSNFYKDLYGWGTNNPDGNSTYAVIADNRFGKCVKVNASTGNAGIYNGNMQRTVGETYTWSVWLRADENFRVAIQHEGSIVSNTNVDLTTEWKRFSGTAQWNGGGAICFYSLYGGIFYIADAKYETGNKATDWSPAPQDTQDQMNSIEVGGRNLVRNSNFSKNTDYWSGISQVIDDSNYGKMAFFNLQSSQALGVQTLAIQHGTYTMSAIVKSNDSTKVTGVGFVFFYTDNSYTDYTWGEHQWLDLGNGYKKVITTGSTDVKKTISRVDIRLLTQSNCTVQFQVGNIKFERGNKATDWTPSPDDIQSQIDLAYSDIEQNANNINLKVDKNGVISQINETSEQITIDANRLNLNGLVRISDLSNSGSTIINGDNVSTGHIKSSLIDTVGLNAEKISTQNSSLYGTIGDVGNGRTGFVLNNVNDNSRIFSLYDFANTSYLEGTDITIKSNGRNNGYYSFLDMSESSMEFSSSDGTNIFGMLMTAVSFSLMYQSQEGQLPTNLVAVDPHGNFEIGGEYRIDAGNGNYYKIPKTNADATGIQLFYENGGNLIWQKNNGELRFSVGGNASDANLKKNIKDSKENYLDVINKMKLHEFDYNGKMGTEGHVNAGIITQEAEEINKDFTQLWGRDTDGTEYNCPNWGSINPYMIGAIQELDKKNKQLEEKLEKLIDKIAELESKTS